MTTKDEIKEIALKWWKDVLQDSLNGSSIFPKEVERFGRIKANETLREFEVIRENLVSLREGSKEKKGYGYTVFWNEVKNRKIGRNEFPRKILFETREDYLKFTGKEKEFAIFQDSANKILQIMPILKDWIIQNPIKVIDNCKNWDALLRVCQYFLEVQKPNLYVRQLPINVHTKFVEENCTVLTSLFEFIIPEHANINEKRFELRYNLKTDEPLIRIRFLDSNLFVQPELSDISIPVSQFMLLRINCKRILIAENKMNFLTLPNMNDSIALWSGGGFNVKHLSQVKWIKGLEILYWGDIDTHGFQILNQVKSYFPQTQGIMMDKKTLDDHKQYVVNGSNTGSYKLDFLNDDELNLYEELKRNNFRLEQERIPQNYSDNYLKQKL